MQLRDERPVLVGGSLEVEEGAAKIMVDNVSPLEEILKKSKRLVFHLDKLDPVEYPRLQSLVKDHPGTTHLSFEIEMQDLNRRVLMEPEELGGVNITNDFFEGVHSLFGRTDFMELRGS